MSFTDRWEYVTLSHSQFRKFSIYFQANKLIQMESHTSWRVVYALLFMIDVCQWFCNFYTEKNFDVIEFFYQSIRRIENLQISCLEILNWISSDEQSTESYFHYDRSPKSRQHRDDPVGNQRATDSRLPNPESVSRRRNLFPSYLYHLSTMCPRENGTCNW